MGEEGSVTGWIQKIKAGEAAAAQKLWERYFSRLVRVCRKRLGSHPRCGADEEDIALNAFHSLYEAARRGRYPQLSDRNDLWRLLVVIAARKVIDQIRRESRRRPPAAGGTLDADAPGRTGVQSAWQDVEQIVGNDPTPEFALVVAEQYQRLLGSLDSDIRQVALWKLEGRTNEEIAVGLDLSVRTVERKLSLIRKTWSGLGVHYGRTSW